MLLYARLRRSALSRRERVRLRELCGDEVEWLRRIARSLSEPASHVARAKALRVVAEGRDDTVAARSAGRRSGDAVAHLVARFNQEGLRAIEPRGGSGAEATYGVAERGWIVRAARRTPDPEQDGTANRSLRAFQRALRKAADGWPGVSTYTIRAVLQEVGWGWPKTRTWCETGQAVRNGQSQRAQDTGTGVMGVPSGDHALRHPALRVLAEQVIKRRALECQRPETPEQIVTLLEATARGWDREPTPFEWGGARAARRRRSRERRHQLGGSGACVRSPLRRNLTLAQQWQRNCQTTH
jgi:hypothetical protein